MRFLQSYFLTFLLIGIVTFLSIRWYRADVARRAPDLQGYDWASHPKSLLIVVPPDECGCGASPVALAEKAIERHLNVVVVFSSSNIVIEKMKKTTPLTGRIAMIKVNPAFITRFAPAKMLSFVQVSNGKIVSQSNNMVTISTIEQLDV